MRDVKNTQTQRIIHMKICLSSYICSFVNVKCEKNLSDLSIIKTTTGEPWPMPQSINTSPTRVSIRPE